MLFLRRICHFEDHLLKKGVPKGTPPFIFCGLDIKHAANREPLLQLG